MMRCAFWWLFEKKMISHYWKFWFQIINSFYSKLDCWFVSYLIAENLGCNVNLQVIYSDWWCSGITRYLTDLLQSWPLFFFHLDSYSVHFNGTWSSCSILLLYSAANHSDVIDQIASASAGKYSSMLLDER